MALYEFIELNLFRGVTPEEGGETECCLQSNRTVSPFPRACYICVHTYAKEAIPWILRAKNGDLKQNQYSSLTLCLLQFSACAGVSHPAATEAHILSKQQKGKKKMSCVDKGKSLGRD